MIHMKTFNLIFFAIAILVVACSTDDEASPSKSVTIDVTAIIPGCVPENFIMIALVDANDKFERATSFDCRTASTIVELTPGDILEIRMYSSDGEFDRSIRYDITVTQNVTNSFKDVEYSGIKYTVQ